MRRILSVLAIMSLCCLAMPRSSSAAGQDDLAAQWNFDEGQGDLAADSSGHGHEAKIEGAARVRQGDGLALSLDGLDDYADGGESKSLGIGGPVAIEAWIRPMRKANGEAVLFGEGYDTYVMTYYNTEMCLFYIGSGGNNVSGKLALGEWNHVVASFDGRNLAMWINGRETGNRESKIKSYQPQGHFIMGTRGQPALPRFKGMIDRVRIYGRAVTAEEAVAHYKQEAAEYGFDPGWFARPRITPYYYFDRGEIVVEADYRGLQPLKGAGRLQVTLFNKQAPGKALCQEAVDPLPGTGVVEVKLRAKDLAAGEYAIVTELKDEQGARPAEPLSFSYPPKPSQLPAPSQRTVPALPPATQPAPFGVTVGKGGGFRIALQGRQYAVRSRISWPQGAFNQLTTDSEPYRQGEPNWQVRVRAAGKNRYRVEAGGRFYTIGRDIEVFPTHVYVKDTYTNTTKEDLGLLIYNEAPLKPNQVTGSWLSGHERQGRQIEASFPDYGPSIFFKDSANGIGMVPIDDVYVVQAVPYVDWEDAAGVGTERFALAPGASCTLEWAVYPTASADYYDFVNAFRKAEGRIGTVAEAPGFITNSLHPPARRRVPDRQYIENRGLKIGIIHCLSFAEDDPSLHIEGIEFTDFPREMGLLRQEAAAIHKAHPGFKAVFHIAHSLYCTNQPDRFPDSKVIGADGKQVSWGDGSDFGDEKKAAGWKWWIFYPTPGNSFHTALMRSVEVIMDDLGFDGAFMDGFLAGYISQWTYDRWDGHSAEIDLNTKTIKRKIGSVILLSQPSLIEFTRRIRDKGGVVVANNTVLTRTITKEKHLIFDNECASGPQLHLAPTVTALANPPLLTEKDIYLDMLDKLSWGELFVYYAEGCEVTYPSLASKEYPMTFEEIRCGLVRGPERIVTMNSGVYGWPGDRRLHLVYRFDGRGAPVAHDFVTSVDPGGVRTELELGPRESAVIEPIPAQLDASSPVNVRVIRYDSRGLHLLLSGEGDAALRVGSGPFDPGKAPGALVGGARADASMKEGTLVIPLKLSGQVDVLLGDPSGAN